MPDQPEGSTLPRTSPEAGGLSTLLILPWSIVPPNPLKIAEATGRFNRRLTSYLRPDVLVVDDVGYLLSASRRSTILKFEQYVVTSARWWGNQRLGGFSRVPVCRRTTGGIWLGSSESHDRDGQYGQGNAFDGDGSV